MFDPGSNDSFWPAPALYYSFASSVDHSMSDLLGLLVYDDMLQYVGHRHYTTGPSRQRQTNKKVVKGLSRLYIVNL
jgi:hypothetical protein